MEQNQQQYLLWYDQSAPAMWFRTLHLGNGIMGATVFGRVPKEKIVLNYTHLWRHAKTKGRVNPDCTQMLSRVRKLMFEGRLEEANLLAYRGLGTQWNLDVEENWFGPDPFVPAGQIDLCVEQDADARMYQNELDMRNGIATTSYQEDGRFFQRQFFTDMNDTVFVGRLTASPGGIDGRIGLSRIEDDQCELDCFAKDQMIFLRGKFFEGVEFVLGLAAKAETGEVSIEEKDGIPGFQMRNAGNVEIYAFAEVNRGNLDPLAVVEKKLKEAVSIPYAERITAHKKIFSSYMERVQLTIQAPEGWTSVDEQTPTDQRLAAFLNGADDPGINAVYYQYGRYMLLCSSINGGKPYNLTGIWNEELNPPYNSDFHHDLNSEAPYWIAETTNLPETVDPLLAYIEELVPAGKEAAQKFYGCNGVYIPLTTGGWPECFKLEGSYDEWTGAAAWLAQHFYQHYQFTLDKEYLAKHAYPYLKEVARFYLDYLVPDPRQDHRFYGMLEAVPSYSPENAFREAGNAPVSLSISCAMDLELITEVMQNVIEASRILDVDEDLREKWQYVLDHIPPLQIGSRGQLMEWQEEYDEDFKSPSSEGFRHRHASHLYALFPGDGITKRKTPELFAAAVTALQERVLKRDSDPMMLSEGGGDMFPALYAALYARAGMAEQSYFHLRLMEKQVYPISNHPREGLRQGTAVTITEMLMQSHDGGIDLLPALPPVYASGEAKGLIARGGYAVDLQWADHKLLSARITASRNGKVIIRYNGQQQVLDLKKKESCDVVFKP